MLETVNATRDLHATMRLNAIKTKHNMARVKFWELFQINPDGTLSPKVKIKIAGVQLDPGVKFTRGVAFSGIDLFQYYGVDLEVNQVEDVHEITGIYK